jgi:spermidine synthase
VSTFAASFRHTALWLTYYDAELVGSDTELALDEERLARRLDAPAIAADLAAVDMGTARDLLSYFLLGDAGVRAFARGAAIHTDDNLTLEFRAPRSQGRFDLPGANVEALAAFREIPVAQAGGDGFWARVADAAPLYDRAHALSLWNRWDDPEFQALLRRLRDEFAEYAPGRFLEARWREVERGRPRPAGSETVALRGPDGSRAMVELTAVTLRVGAERGVVLLVDNAAREVWAESYVDAPAGEVDARIRRLADRLLASLRAERARAAGAPSSRAELVERVTRLAEDPGPAD